MSNTLEDYKNLKDLCGKMDTLIVRNLDRYLQSGIDAELYETFLSIQGIMSQLIVHKFT